GVFLMLISGFDAEYSRRSAGALAFEDLARACIAAQDRVLDFTIGDEPYKQLFGARPTPLWTVTASGTPLGFIANTALAYRPKRAAHDRREDDARTGAKGPTPHLPNAHLGQG